MRLGRYVDALVARGLAVLTYDPRCLGESDGSPRQVIDPGRLVEDALAAVGHLRARPDVAVVGLLGLSLGGGVAMQAAVEDPDVRALAHVVGYTRPALARSEAATEALAAAALDDVAAAERGESVVVPICGWPGETAVIATYDAMYGMALLDESGEERNEVAARSLLPLSTFAPADRASSLRCPVLYYACENDVVTPYDPTVPEATASCEVVMYRGSHFDVFHGARGRHAATTVARFLASSLGAASRLAEDGEFGAGADMELGVTP